MVRGRRIFSVLIFPFLLFLSCTTPPQSMIKDSLDKGNLYFENGWYEEAITSYNQVITTLGNKSDPNVTTAYYNRDLAYLITHDDDQAILDFTSPPQSIIKDSLDKGNLYFENGWYEEAIASYGQVITTLVNKSDPNLVTAYYNRGLAYLITHDDDQAILDFTSVITLNPEDAQAYVCRGNVWRRKQCSDKAINDFNMAIEKDPHNMESYYALGMTYFKQNNYWKTVEILSRAIVIDPNFAKAYNGRGQAYMQSGIITKAIPDFRKACDMGEQCGCIMLELIAKQAHQLTYNAETPVKKTIVFKK